MVLTDVEGLYRDWPDSDDVIQEISPETLAELMPVARQRAWSRRCRPATTPSPGECPRATVVDGREPHAVLLELFTDEGVGTQVLPGVETRLRKAYADRRAEGRDMSDLQARYAESLMNTFGPPKLVLTRGEGAYVWDDAGTRVRRPARRHRGQRRSATRHPALVEAVTDAAADPRPRLELLRHRAAGRARRAAARLC